MYSETGVLTNFRNIMVYRSSNSELDDIDHLGPILRSKFAAGDREYSNQSEANLNTD